MRISEEDAREHGLLPPKKKGRRGGDRKSSRDFEKAVVDLAKLCGWLVHHIRPARTAKGWRTPVQGDKGFPDLVLVPFRMRPAYNPSVLFVELKTGKAVLTSDQALWLVALRRAGARAVTWRPSDWLEIEAILRGDRQL